MSLELLALIAQICHFSGPNTAKAELECQKWMVRCWEANYETVKPQDTEESLKACMLKREVKA